MDTEALIRMKKLGISQVQMVTMLAKKGIKVQVPEISQMLRGISTYPKAMRVLNEIEVILNDYEQSIGRV